MVSLIIAIDLRGKAIPSRRDIPSLTWHQGAWPACGLRPQSRSTGHSTMTIWLTDTSKLWDRTGCWRSRFLVRGCIGGDAGGPPSCGITDVPTFTCGPGRKWSSQHVPADVSRCFHYVPQSPLLRRLRSVSVVQPQSNYRQSPAHQAAAVRTVTALSSTR